MTPMPWSRHRDDDHDTTGRLWRGGVPGCQGHWMGGMSDNGGDGRRSLQLRQDKDQRTSKKDKITGQVVSVE